MQSPRPDSTSLVQRRLLEELERAFGGDQGARIFVQAALRAARLTALPREAGPMLDFVRAHLLGAVVGELGPRGAAELLTRLTATLEELPVGGPLESGVQPREGALSAPRSSTVRLRVALVHGDRFGRVSLARQLVQSACDVVVLDSFAELAALGGELPALALVHLGAPEVELLLAGMLAKNPELHVLAIDGDPTETERRLGAMGARRVTVAPPTARPLELAVLVRRLAG